MIQELIQKKKKITLQSSKSRDVEDFIEVAEKIALFLCLAMDKSVSIKNIKLTSDDSPRKKCHLFYESRPFTANIKEHRFNSLLDFEDIKPNFEQIINKWIKIINLTNPALYLYLLPNTQRVPQDVFSNLIQASEAYCQRFHKETAGKKFSLIFNTMFEVLFEEIMKKSNLSKKKYEDIFPVIQNTRNYVTHYNPDKEDASMDTKDIHYINEFIEGLFQIKLLEGLDIESSLIEKIYNDQFKKFKRLYWQLCRLEWIDWSKYKIQENENSKKPEVT